MKIALVTIARMNPPTLGHLQLIKKIMLYATFVKEKDIFIILSNTEDKKNPLSCDRKKELLNSLGMINSLKISATKEEAAIKDINVHIFCMKDPLSESIPGKEFCSINTTKKQICGIVKKYKPRTFRIFIGNDRGGNYGFIGKYLLEQSPPITFEEDITIRRELKSDTVTSMTKSSDIEFENVSASLLRSLVQNNLPDLFIDLCLRAGLNRENSRILFDEINRKLFIGKTKAATSTSTSTSASASTSTEASSSKPRSIKKPAVAKKGSIKGKPKPKLGRNNKSRKK
jgi:hypothetical protein